MTHDAYDAIDATRWSMLKLMAKSPVLLLLCSGKECRIAHLKAYAALKETK